MSLLDIANRQAVRLTGLRAPRPFGIGQAGRADGPQKPYRVTAAIVHPWLRSPHRLAGTIERPRADGPRPLLFKCGPQGTRDASLELDLRAGLLESGLDLGGFFLADAFLDGLGSALDQVLGFLEAEGGDG